MAAEPLPDDRSVRVVARKLKTYAQYKGKQSQSGQDEASLDADLTTIANYCADEEETGQAWARQRLSQIQRDEQLAARWQTLVREDQHKAAEEDKARKQVSTDQIRDELNRQMDQHAAAVAALAESKEPGFRGKLSQVRQESLQAKKFLDENLESSLEHSTKRRAAARKHRQQVAAALQERADGGKTWRDQYQQYPSRYPQGQREDVQAALQRIDAGARRRAEHLPLLGGDAGPHIEALQQISSWCQAGLTPRETMTTGLEHARDSFAALDAFEAQVEREANDNFAAFRQWTQTNTERARRWINSDSDKHRLWAEAWLGKKGSA